MKRCNSMPSRAHRIAALALTFLAALLLVATTPSPVQAGAPDKRLKVEWVGRHREVTFEHKNAADQLEKAQAAHAKARNRNRLQGQRRIELTAELDAAKTRYAAAKQAMDDFPGEAHRAGAPPGWFR